MDRNVGVWIDHKQAFLIWYETNRVEVITSNIEPPAHFSGGTQLGGRLNQKGDMELRNNSRYKLQLHKYYQQIVTNLKSASSIFVMGPGEAKIEFERFLKKYKTMQKRLIKVETADKMTRNQMVAHVRSFYQKQTTIT